MRKLLGMVAVISAVLAAPAARSETLADALIAAYKNSNLLDQNQAVLRAADEDVAIAVAGLRPVVQYTIQSGFASQEYRVGTATPWAESLNTSISLSASLMLLDFGRTKLGIQIAEESVLATRQALVNVEQNVLLDAVAAYVDVRLQSEIVALRQSNLRLITQELRAARDRFDVGDVTRTDVAQAEARLAEARSGSSAAEGNLLLARERYKAATGAYPGRLAALPRAPATAKSLEAAQAVALRSHPSVLQQVHQAKIADLAVAMARANMKPTLTGRAAINENFSGRAEGLDSQTLGLTFNQTIYAGGELSALYRQSLAGQDQSRAGLRQVGVVVTENVGRAWAGLSVSAASIESGDRQIRAAQTAFDGVREEATLGARTTLDVLNAEQDLLDARAARLEAEANRYVGVYQLLSSMGLLTADHLKLGIPTFDPQAYYKAVRNAPATSAQGKRLDKILEKIGN